MYDIYVGSVCVCVGRMSEEFRVRSLEAGVTNRCELPDINAGNVAQVLWKTDTCL